MALVVVVMVLPVVEADIHRADRMAHEVGMLHQQDEFHHNKAMEDEADIQIEVSVLIGVEVATLDLPQWPERSEVVWQLEL